MTLLALVAGERFDGGGGASGVPVTARGRICRFRRCSARSPR